MNTLNNTSEWKQELEELLGGWELDPRGLKYVNSFVENLLTSQKQQILDIVEGMYKSGTREIVFNDMENLRRTFIEIEAKGYNSALSDLKSRIEQL